MSARRESPPVVADAQDLEPVFAARRPHRRHVADSVPEEGTGERHHERDEASFGPGRRCSYSSIAASLGIRSAQTPLLQEMRSAEWVEAVIRPPSPMKPV
jgi:hypothetical protein